MEKKSGTEENSMSFNLSPEVMERYEGMCIGLKNGKVVASGKNAGKVLRELLTKGKGDEITFACVPSRNAVMIK